MWSLPSSPALSPLLLFFFFFVIPLSLQSSLLSLLLVPVHASAHKEEREISLSFSLFLSPSLLSLTLSFSSSLSFSPARLSLSFPCKLSLARGLSLPLALSLSQQKFHREERWEEKPFSGDFSLWKFPSWGEISFSLFPSFSLLRRKFRCEERREEKSCDFSLSLPFSLSLSHNGNFHCEERFPSLFPEPLFLEIERRTSPYFFTSPHDRNYFRREVTARGISPLSFFFSSLSCSLPLPGLSLVPSLPLPLLPLSLTRGHTWGGEGNIASSTSSRLFSSFGPW